MRPLSISFAFLLSAFPIDVKAKEIKGIAQPTITLTNNIRSNRKAQKGNHNQQVKTNIIIIENGQLTFSIDEMRETQNANIDSKTQTKKPIKIKTNGEL